MTLIAGKPIGVVATFRVRLLDLLAAYRDHRRRCERAEGHRALGYGRSGRRRAGSPGAIMALPAQTVEAACAR
jgi:hypothetical protein